MSSSQEASRPGTRGPITIRVNGESRTLESPCHVADLLAALDMQGKRVAVAVNRDVVVRSRHAEVLLAEGDRVEILEAVGGG